MLVPSHFAFVCVCVRTRFHHKFRQAYFCNFKSAFCNLPVRQVTENNSLFACPFSVYKLDSVSFLYSSNFYINQSKATVRLSSYSSISKVTGNFLDAKGSIPGRIRDFSLRPDRLWVLPPASYPISNEDIFLG